MLEDIAVYIDWYIGKQEQILRQEIIEGTLVSKKKCCFPACE